MLTEKRRGVNLKWNGPVKTKDKRKIVTAFSQNN